MAGQGSGAGIVAGNLNVCPGSPGSGLAGIESRPYVLGEPVPKTPGAVTGANVQFHPRDFGTLAEIQENRPGQGDFPRNKGTYFPAGNTWQNGVDARPHGRVTTGFAAVEIAPRDGDPAEVCARWMHGVGAGCSIDPAQPGTLRLAGGQTMRFVEPAPGGRTGVVGRGPVGGARGAQDVRVAGHLRGEVDPRRSGGVVLVAAGIVGRRDGCVPVSVLRCRAP